MENGNINVEKERVESLRKKAFKLLMILASGRRINIKKIEPVTNRESLSRNSSGISFNTNSDLDYLSDWNSVCNESRRSTMTTPDLELDSSIEDIFRY